MKMPWTRAREKEQASERRNEAHLDEQLRVLHLHQLSEDMGFPGDPSFYCEDATVGDGHSHRLMALWRSDRSYMWANGEEK